MFYVKIWLIVTVNFLIHSATIAANNNLLDMERKSKNNHSSYLLSIAEEDKPTNEKYVKYMTTTTTMNGVGDGMDLATDKLIMNIEERSTTVERNAYPNVVARKGVITNSKNNLMNNSSSNISVKKGVDSNSDIIQLNTKDNLTDINLINNTTIKRINTIKRKKFRPKPIATIRDGSSSRVEISSSNINNDSKLITYGSPTKSPQLGIPKKINYVVPVIISILTLPLFVISIIYIYKNGRDCWEKRHYRRMDFLIDGMYNE